MRNHTATYVNFAVENILNGDDGLPSHPFQPKYGQWTYPVTEDGDGREQVEAHVTYFEGKYWMHAATWGCGGSLFVYAALSNMNWPAPPVYPPGDYGEDGNCGIKSFSSLDFTNWKLESFYQPSISVANVTKPVVRYSVARGEYVMFMGGTLMSNFYFAIAASPGGPWSDPPQLMNGSHVSHDFDIAAGPDGTHYMVSDVWSGLYSDSTGWGAPVWDIWVQQLTPELTSTVGTNTTSVLIRSASELKKQNLTLEASGFFFHEGYWYMTFGKTCQNCNGYIYYYYAEQPLGPYLDGGFISSDGCGGQNKGANVLPTPDGEVVLAGVLGYRTSPSDLFHDGNLWHADNHQAASSTFFFPLEFNDNHTLKAINCTGTLELPLMSELSEPPPSPIPYRLDCRIVNGQSIVQSYNPPKLASNIALPVWQRTWNLGPTLNAGPALDGILDVKVGFADGSHMVFLWPSSNISWAPAKISLQLSEMKLITDITLSTNATNGCYGTLAMPKNDTTVTYGAMHDRNFRNSPDAEMFVPRY